MDLRSEWVRYDSSGTPVPAYIAWPSRAPGPLPAILIIHEVWGLNDHIRDLVHRFVAAGYLAAAPDLYAHGGERPPELSTERIAAVEAFVRTVPLATLMTPSQREGALAPLPSPRGARSREHWTRSSPPTAPWNDSWPTSGPLSPSSPSTRWRGGSGWGRSDTAWAGASAPCSPAPTRDSRRPRSTTGSRHPPSAPRRSPAPSSVSTGGPTPGSPTASPGSPRPWGPPGNPSSTSSTGGRPTPSSTTSTPPTAWTLPATRGCGRCPSSPATSRPRRQAPPPLHDEEGGHGAPDPACDPERGRDEQPLGHPVSGRLLQVQELEEVTAQVPEEPVVELRRAVGAVGRARLDGGIVGPHRADPAVGQPPEGPGPESRPPAPCAVRALEVLGDPPGPDQEDVAGPHLHPGLQEGAVEVLRLHHVPRLQPRQAPRPRNVGEDASGHEGHPVDGEAARAAAPHDVARHAVVEAAPVGHVCQGIHVGEVVGVEREDVDGHLTPRRAGVVPDGHPVDHPVAERRREAGLHGDGQGVHRPASHEAACVHDGLGGHQVQRPPLVVRAPAAPVGEIFLCAHKPPRSPHGWKDPQGDFSPRPPIPRAGNFPRRDTFS